MKEDSKPQWARFEQLFLRYGAGSQVFTPVIRWRWWNGFSWVLIVLGIIGWACGLWFLRGFSE